MPAATSIGSGGGVGPSREAATRHGTGRAAELLVVALGLGLVVAAFLANLGWFDRHFLPHMFFPRRQQVTWWMAERVTVALVGLALVFPGRRWIGHAVRAGQGAELLLRLALAAVAIPLALAASEAILRAGNWAPVEHWADLEEPLRQADPAIGWINVPDRAGFSRFGNQRIRYDLDADGRRIAAPRSTIDPSRPSALFVGESITFGFGLNWPQTAAAQIGAATGLQTVNLGVNGYGPDQELMRLRQELPRFARPRIVVALFAPSLLERSLDHHRPYLDAALRWHSGQPAWHLKRVFRNLFHYHSTQAIDAGIAMTRQCLRAIVADARARHADALVLVPQFGTEQPAERAIRLRVLAGIPYVRVQLDPRWHIPIDGHPDAQANRVMSGAVLAALARLSRQQRAQARVD